MHSLDFFNKNIWYVHDVKTEKLVDHFNLYTTCQKFEAFIQQGCVQLI